MTRPVWRIASSRSPVSSMRSSARSPTPATSPGRALARDVHADARRLPCASSSHSVGTAISSPSRSRCVMSASTTEGRVPGVVQLLAPRLDARLRRRGRAACAAAVARSAFFSPKARAISRVPTLPLCVPMKATSSSLARGGRMAGISCRTIFLQDDRKGRRGLAQSPAPVALRPPSPGLACELGVRLFSSACAAFLASARRLGDACCVRLARASCGARARLLRASLLRRARLDQLDRLLERDRRPECCRRDRRVDAVVGDVRA